MTESYRQELHAEPSEQINSDIRRRGGEPLAARCSDLKLKTDE